MPFKNFGEFTADQVKQIDALKTEKEALIGQRDDLRKRLETTDVHRQISILKQATDQCSKDLSEKEKDLARLQRELGQVNDQKQEVWLKLQAEWKKKDDELILLRERLRVEQQHYADLSRRFGQV